MDTIEETKIKYEQIKDGKCGFIASLNDLQNFLENNVYIACT